MERFQTQNGLNVTLWPIAGAKQTAVLIVFRIGGNQDPKGRSEEPRVLLNISTQRQERGQQKSERRTNGWRVAGRTRRPVKTIP